MKPYCLCVFRSALHRFFIAVFLSSCNTRIWTALHIVSTMHLIFLKTTSSFCSVQFRRVSTFTSPPNQLNNSKPSSVRHQRAIQPQHIHPVRLREPCRSAMHSLNLYLYKRRPWWQRRSGGGVGGRRGVLYSSSVSCVCLRSGGGDATTSTGEVTQSHRQTHAIAMRFTI